MEVVHEVYGHLLKLLCKARQYVGKWMVVMMVMMMMMKILKLINNLTDGQGHGTSKLVPYFSVLNYCLISKTEKLMVSCYFLTNLLIKFWDLICN